MNNILIEYSGTKIRLLQHNSERVIFLDQLEFVDSGFFYLEPKVNSKKVGEFTELLVSHLHKHNIIANAIKLVLDSRLAYISCIPLEFSDELENINSSLIWELSNFYPENYKNFKINFQKINQDNDELAYLGNTLIVAYNKNIAEVIRRISEVSSLRVSGVNFDIFTAGNFISKNYVKNFVSVGVKNNRVDLSFYIKGAVSFFLPVNIKEGNFEEVLDELKKMLPIPGYEEINNVYVYGESSAKVFYSLLEKENLKQKISLADPFELYKPDSLFLENRPDKLHSFSFTSVFGLL